MDALESLRMGLRAIRGHRLRSALTTLGVVIGVAAVITLVTLGTSLQAEVIGQLGGAGANTINVWTRPGEAGGPPGVGAQPVFTERDVARLASLDGVAAVVPQGAVSIAAVSVGNDTVAQSTMTATTPEFAGPGQFADGRTFRMGAREVVLNRQAAALFAPNVTVGDVLFVTLASGRTVRARVVGVLSGSGTLGPFAGFGGQPRIFVPADPYYASRVRSPATGERQRVYPLLVVVADGPEAVPVAQDEVRSYLTGRSDAAELVPAGYEFSVQTNEELLGQVRELLGTLTGFISSIAVVSLVVGSIGIANVMLVSVAERTREIGIMKAVGAANGDVLQLFLVEAVVLGVAGAVGGTALGVAAGYVATAYVDLPLVFPPEWAGVAVAVGLVVGVVSGLYPAWRAARVDPIDALRYE